MQTLQSNIDAVTSELERLKSEQKQLIAGFKEQVADIEGKIKALAEQIKKVNEQYQKLQTILKKMEELVPKIMELIAQDNDAEKARVALTSISTDRSKAAKLLGAIKSNNRTLISEILRPISDALTISIQDVKNVDGLTVVYRLGNLSHCISTKNQCGGGAFSTIK